MTQRPPSPDALAEQFVGLARRLGRASRRATLGGLSPARYDALHTVFHHDGISMSELAGHLGVVARTVTGLVDGLAGDGLLRREPDATDRRRTNLFVTPAARAVLHEARRSRLAMTAAPFRTLDADERTVLAALLARLESEAERGTGAR